MQELSRCYPLDDCVVSVYFAGIDQKCPQIDMQPSKKAIISEN